MLSEDNAAHPVGCVSALQIEMTVWRPFCLSTNFLGRVWQPSDDNNGAPKSQYYLQRAVTPDQITQQNSLQRAGAEKAEKALWGLISRPILDLGFFLKSMSPQDKGRQLWGYPGIVSLRQFRDNEAWMQLGQESPLMNKTGSKSWTGTSCTKEWGQVQKY